MNKNLILAFVMIIFVGLSGSLTAQTPQKDDPKPSTSATPTPERLERELPFDGEIDFPEIDGWDLSRKITFPQRELGYSYNYESDEAGRVTVYVYTAGVRNIPDLLTGPVAQQMRQAQNDIKQAVEMGAYESSKVVRSETITLGGKEGKVKSLYTLLLLKARGMELDSEIYVFPYKGYFVKFRATRPKSDGARNEMMESLLREMDILFSK